MPEQLSFGGLDFIRRTRPSDGGRVYLALLPNEAASTRCVLCARDTQRQTGLRGRIREGQFHISLHGIGLFEELTEDVGTHVRKAAAGVSVESFDIQFDRVMSFGNNAVALAGPPERRGPVHDLFAELGLALGLRGKSFRPHLTLFYVNRPTAEWPMAERWIEPIGWTVRDFVLVHSHHGLVAIGKWPLSEPSRAAPGL